VSSTAPTFRTYPLPKIAVFLMKRLLSKIAGGAILALLISRASGQTKFPDGPGKDAVLKVCGQCHPADILVGLGKSRDGWAATVDDMVAKGASGSDEELQEIVAYLSKNFGKSTGGKINVNTATLKDLRERLDLSLKEAQAIVDYREEHGSFKSWADLRKVPDLDIPRLEAKKDKIAF
jgi:competence protein ComEA